MKDLTTLLVEASIAEAGLLTAALERLELFRDSAEAIALLTTPQPVHLVLANWTQSGSSGLELAGAVRRAARVRVPIVLYSRSVDADDERSASHHGIGRCRRAPAERDRINARQHRL